MLFPYTLGIVAIMKNEGPYVKEWLDYHLNAGVDIIYLYDNDSSDELEEIVTPYIEKGLVVYHKFPGLVPQLRCYNEALKKYRWVCKYLAFIDADEFIYPTNGGSIKDFVEKFFEGKENAAAIRIYWYLFGSAGEVNADLSRGVLDRFRFRDKDVNGQGKIILNPRLTVEFQATPHLSICLANLFVVNEWGEDKKTIDYITGDKIFIAHYSTKSKNEYIARHNGYDVFFKIPRQVNKDGTFNETMFKEFDKNDVEDNRVYEYYLKNLKSPHIPQKTELSKCANYALQILNNSEITNNTKMMEEIFYALHTLEASKFFSNDGDFKKLKELCQSSFFNITKNISTISNNVIVYSLALFINEIPFLLKSNIFDTKYIKALANSYYDILQTLYLKSLDFSRASLLRENKKWLNAL